MNSGAIRDLVRTKKYPESIVLLVRRWQWMLFWGVAFFGSCTAFLVIAGLPERGGLAALLLGLPATAFFLYLFLKRLMGTHELLLYLDSHCFVSKYATHKAMFATWGECSTFDPWTQFSKHVLRADFSERGETADVPGCQVLKPKFDAVVLDARQYGLKGHELKKLIDHYQTICANPQSSNAVDS